MFFTKYPHRANFTFATDYDPASGTLTAGKRQMKTRIRAYEGGIHHIRISHSDWGPNRSITPLEPPVECDCLPLAAETEDFSLTLFDPEGHPILKTTPGSSFGVSGKAWMFCFNVDPQSKFYGMGEKNFNRLELSGIRTKFWNTDVWGDFHFGQWMDHSTDPPYLSVPYVIVKQGDAYIGLLLHTPAPAFIQTPGLDKDRVFEEWRHISPQLIVGAEDGEADLWIIYGPSLRELTRKLQKLVGVTPVPPLWSLGYHQSRWGYAGHSDLVALDENFAKYEIPCDGLWLDIDYMDGFRVFTVDDKLFPKGLSHTAKQLAQNNRRIVAILDPGVKQDPGYKVYDDLKSKNLYCVNPEGTEFVGMVWPGDTIFPDLTLADAQEWWADYVKDLSDEGLGGAWVDMNDPSTGPVDPTSMLFNHGKDAHALQRNQYALGMQMGTYKGFLKSRPNERPFVLSRSGSTGTSRYSAVWTGDNLSNYFYLKMSIPTTLNLSLSGICFNGPDVGGFGSSTSEKLMVDWIKACFLFPFMRNHNSKGSKDQEPWVFSHETMEIVRKFVRLRYKFLPYIYNLFIDQEELGDPIVRPLIYHFEGRRSMRLDNLADQFLIGPCLLQAPLLDSRRRERKVVLPGRERWLDASSGEWEIPGSRKVSPTDTSTPLYMRSGAVIPLRPGAAMDNRTDLRKVDVFIAANPTSAGSARYSYRADDGISFAYREGIRSEVDIRARWQAGEISIDTEPISSRFGEISLSFVIPEGFTEILLNGRTVQPKIGTLEITGSPLAVLTCT